MIYLSGLVGLLLVLTAEARVGNSTELPFCTETEECLLFTPICNTEKYEARKYSSVKWVSTEETSYFMEMASMRAFRRLYKYITGANSDGVNIDMTAPVVIKMPVKSFWRAGVYKMSFVIPSAHQSKTPEPTDKKVFIETMPDMEVYSRSYGGWMTSLSDNNNADSLMSDLDTAGAKYNKKFHYAVGYNSPMTFFNRHNEVWVKAEDDAECSSSEEMELNPFS